MAPNHKLEFVSRYLVQRCYGGEELPENFEQEVEAASNELVQLTEELQNDRIRAEQEVTEVRTVERAIHVDRCRSI